jgi:hypothetical protein
MLAVWRMGGAAVKRYLLVAWLLAVLALASCGEGDDTATESESSPPVSAGSPPAVPSVDPREATMNQYASLIAEHEGGWRESVVTIDEACTDPDAIPLCVAAYLTASLQAQTLQLVLSAAPENVGEAHPEIADLVADTESAAADYAEAYEAWSDTGCTDPLDRQCGVSEAFAMSSALAELTRKFDAWRPYTG